MSWRRYWTYAILSAGIVASLIATTLSPVAHAQDEEFSLQLTPSPLVTTVKPGVASDIELKIRNGGRKTEELKIEPRSFKIDANSQEVKLDDTTPPDISEWMSFSSPTFTIQPEQWFTEKIKLDLPENAGFSYSFALVISRKDDPKPVEGSRLLRGSVAVFTLVNVDRPGATRKLDLGTFKIGKHMYEYLPADLSLQLKNSGNSIVQPYGNIYIQRGKNDKTPIATLSVNSNKGYMLPDATRTFQTGWNDGFPAYQTITGNDGQQHRKLVWDWSKVSDLRIGRYTAKLVAVYNDGHRDVPLEAEITFWVIPWKVLGGLFVVLVILLFGIYSFVRQVIVLARRRKHPKHHSS